MFSLDTIQLLLVFLLLYGCTVVQDQCTYCTLYYCITTSLPVSYFNTVHGQCITIVLDTSNILYCLLLLIVARYSVVHKGLRLIRIMKGGYALPVNTGSRLLQKVSCTSCEEFNRKVFDLLDRVKQMEHKYKVLDPRKICDDPEYSMYGPIALITTLHEIYGRLLTDHDWPALATKLPQSNNVTATSTSAKTGGDKPDINCFRCKGNHHVKECPKKRNKDRDGDKAADKSAGEPSAKKAKSSLPAWRYVEPKDLATALVDDSTGKNGSFVPSVSVVSHPGKKGLYLLSHFDSEHDDNYTPHTPSNESNLASVDVPMGIPAATTRDPTTVPLDDDEDPIEFQGAWCASVSNAVPIPIPVSQSLATSQANAPRRSSRANKGTFSKPRYIDEAF